MFRHAIMGLAIFQVISCDFILPTYRPPPTKTPTYRFRRETSQQEPLWIYQGDDIERAPSSADHQFLPQYIDDIRLNSNTRYARSTDHDDPIWIFKGDDIPKAPTTADHPFLPKYIDDIKLDPNNRYVRSVDSPSARRGGATGTRSNSGRGDTGPTHPGYNKRNARSTDHDDPIWIFKGDDIPKAPTTADHPFLPKNIDDIKLDHYQRFARSIELVDPLKLIKPRPSPFNPDWPRQRFPLYAGSSRVARDIQIVGVTDKKPTHRDVIIPNWNPNARIKPWQTIGVRRN